MDDKKNLGPVNALYPSLDTIVGCIVDGRVNWLNVAHVGIMNHGQPQYLSIGLNIRHFSPKGIREHKEFSINIPGRALVREADYVGLVSGKKTDKSQVFETFHGQLPHAPMIKGCPVCMELRLDRILDFSTHEVFVGEIVNTYADPAVLTEDGKIDLLKVDPLLFDMSSMHYYSLGEKLAPCWNVGKELKGKGGEE